MSRCDRKLPLRAAPPPPRPLTKKKLPPPRPPPPSRAPEPLLIDFSSPPSSPTNYQPDTHSVGSSSGKTESGFEDDFDVDPFSPSDPFSPPKSTTTARNAVFNNINVPVLDAKEFPDFLCNGRTAPSKVQVRSGPTVIRAKPARPKTPPMPAAPPPPPPPELRAELERIESLVQDDPYAIALYDFPGSHPDDLPFSVGDKIRLLKRIDNQWFYGKLRSGIEGMFPANFVDVKVPLDNVATVLYDFEPQESGDLRLIANTRVVLLHRVNDGWVFGESNGIRGQFPANYVDNVPSDLKYN